ncbi:MAG TPA: M24 family metallopeptidase, partial [Pirellulales bacterium]
PGVKMHDFVGALLKELKIKLIGLESHATTLDVKEAIAAQSPDDTIWTPVAGTVEALRIRKDADEIATTKKAVYYAQEAFARVTAAMKLSDTEWDVAAELEYTIRKLGGQGCSFEPIVAVGPRSALPHARASHLKLSDNPILLIDWGAFADGYASDLTRVLATGSIPPKFEQVYRTVLAAQMAAIAAIGPGKKTQDIDAVARGVITDAGFGDLFGHGLGHGLGLYIHEAPRLAPNTDVTLEPGMIVTVEPGIYLPGEFGVRIEDDVLVTETGHEVLTSTPKQWENVMIAK